MRHRTAKTKTQIASIHARRDMSDHFAKHATLKELYGGNHTPKQESMNVLTAVT